MATLIRGDGRTVNAYQDSIMGDFAFSGKDGIVKNVGQACGLDTTTLNSVKVKSGMVVIQGRQITLDGTDSISLPVATGSTVYWTTLYLELDLSAIADDGKAGKVTLKKLEYTSSYPAVPTSDNLKVQTAGKAYLGLYRFKNTANGITSSEQIAEIIDSGDILSTVNNIISGETEVAKSDTSNSIQEVILSNEYYTFSNKGAHSFTLNDNIGNYDEIKIYGGNLTGNKCLVASIQPSSLGSITYNVLPIYYNSSGGIGLALITTEGSSGNKISMYNNSYTVEPCTAQIKGITGIKRKEI